MIFNDLRDFIKESEKLGELKLIEGADWDLEIGAITEWQSQPNTPLLLFDNIKDYPAGFRVMTNFATSPRRLAMAMGLPKTVEKPMDFVRGWREKLRIKNP